MKDNPSLKSRLDEAMRSGYLRAVNEAVAETGFVRSTFPDDCPYTFEQAIHTDFWPE